MTASRTGGRLWFIYNAICFVHFTAFHMQTYELMAYNNGIYMDLSAISFWILYILLSCISIKKY